MASLLLRRSTRLPLCLGAGTLLLAPQLSSFHRIAYCDSPSAAVPFSSTYSESAKVPIFKDGRPNPAAYRQISAGSIFGLVGGVAVSYFSKTLAFFLGLAVCGAQYLANRGINVIPTEKLQQYVKGIDWRSALEDNAAFKLSFGVTFALASLAEF